MLFTALIAPHFIDWNARRDLFEERAAEAVGHPVEIRGKIDLRLLPTPVLTLADVEVGDGPAPYLELERFRAELELAPLLKGEFRIVHMLVERPHLRVAFRGPAQGDDPPEPDETRVRRDRVSLARVEIVDGRAEIDNYPNGRAWQVEGLQGIIEATSLAGPFKAEADMMLNGSPVSVKLATGRLEATDGITAKLQVRSPLYPALLVADGVAELADGALGYEGDFTLVGTEPVEGAPRTAWTDFRAAGGFVLSPAALELDGAQLSWGALERPLVLQLSGRMDFGDDLRYEAFVGARQVDVDFMLGHDRQKPVPAASIATALFRNLPRLPLSPAEGVVRIKTQGIVVGGSVIEGVQADFASAPDGWEIRRLTAKLPGNGRLAVDGMLTLSASPSFRGHAAIASETPAPLFAWLRGDAGDAAAIGRFDVEADVDLAATRREFTDISAEFGDGKIVGKATFNAFPGSEGAAGRGISNLTLQGERVDLSALLAFGSLLPAEAFAAEDFGNLTVDFSADVVEAGGIDAHSVVIGAAAENGVVKLTNVTVGDLAGAQIALSGTVSEAWSAPSGDIRLSVDAPRLTGAVAFLAELLPDASDIATLRTAARALSPIEAGVLDVGFAKGGLKALTVNGTFGGTHVDLAVDAEGAPTDLQNFAGTARLTLDAPDFARVLAQLGLPSPQDAAGPVHAEANFSGSLAEGGALTIENASLAGVTLSYAARSMLRDGLVELQGELDASAESLDAAARLAGIELAGSAPAASVEGVLKVDAAGFDLALHDTRVDGLPVAGRLKGLFGDPVTLTGELQLAELSLPALFGALTGASPRREGGEWPNEPFAATLPVHMKADLEVRADHVDVGAPVLAADAILKFALEKDRVELQVLQSRFADGELKGSLTGAVDNGVLTAGIRAEIGGADLAAIVWRPDDSPAATGLLDISLNGSAEGRTMAGLLASLEGEGTFALSEGQIMRLDPGVLREAVLVANEEAEPDEDLIREIFYSGIGNGSFGFDRASGALSVAGGVVDVPPVTVETGDAAIMAEASVDLNDLTLSSEWTIRAEEAGRPEDDPEPAIEVFFDGPIADPDREFDVQPLIALVNLRYQLRQVQKIEALQEARRREEAERLAAEAAAPVDPEPPDADGQRGVGAVSLPNLRPESSFGAPLTLFPPVGQDNGEADVMHRLAPAFEGLDVNPN